MLNSFKFKFIVEYIELNKGLSPKYHHFMMLSNVLNCLGNYTYEFSFYRGYVPYSFIRYYLLLAMYLEEFNFKEFS